MKILLTGASGFLGKIFLEKWRNEHQVTGMGRSPASQIICDLTESIPHLPVFDMVVHAAGKAHMTPKTATEENDFFRANVEGTRNLLLGLEASGNLPKALVFISSVSVYGLESGQEIEEHTPSRPTTAYGKSKAAAEELILFWGRQNQVNTVILRLPLIIGPEPPGNLGAMIRAIQMGYYFRVGEGSARRSVVRAGDVAGLIPDLIAKHGIFNLTDGFHPTVKEIDTWLANQYGKKIRVIPEGVAKWIAKSGDIFSFMPVNSEKIEKLTQSLTFSDKLAREYLNWSPAPFSIVPE